MDYKALKIKAVYLVGEPRVTSVLKSLLDQDAFWGLQYDRYGCEALTVWPEPGSMSPEDWQAACDLLVAELGLEPRFYGWVPVPAPAPPPKPPKYHGPQHRRAGGPSGRFLKGPLSSPWDD